MKRDQLLAEIKPFVLEWVTGYTTINVSDAPGVSHAAFVGLEDDSNTDVDPDGINYRIKIEGGNGLTSTAGTNVVTLAVGQGDGLTVGGNDIALTTPGTLTVSTSNSASGNHTHSITSASNPGAAASILATDASGFVKLQGLGLVSGTASSTNPFSCSATISNPGGYAYNIISNLTVSNTTTHAYALSSIVYSNVSGDSSRDMVGANFRVTHQSTNTLSGTVAAFIAQIYQTAAGTINNAYGIQAGGISNPSGTIGTRHAVYIPDGAGTITTNYGLHILGQTAGGTNYSIYTGAGQVSLGDNLNFRQASTISTTSGDLTINASGDILVSDNLETDNFASKTTGWQATYAGAADFRSIYADELRVQAFIAEIYEALVGAIIVTKSRAKLSRDFTIPWGAEITGVDGDVSAAAITDVDTGTETFMISGDETSNISNGDKFEVSGSTGNDGVWTVSSSSYDGIDDETDIVVTGDITDATVDGSITFLHYFSVAGDQTSEVVATDTVYVNASTGNDGTWTVDSVSYDAGDVETDIYPTTAIGNSTADGGIGKAGTIYVEDLEGWDDTQVFSANDYLRLRHIDRSGGGLVVVDVWGEVSSYSDLSGGEQSWTFTTTDSNTVAGDTIYTGSLALDYGQDGSGSQGIWEATVLDTAGAPYSGVKTWTDNPWTNGNWSTNVRVGNLDGISGVGLEYGLWAGQGTANADAWILLSDSNVEFHNIPVRMNDGTNYTVKIEPDGDAFFGENIGAIATTSLVHFATAQTYNGESIGAGDLLIGDHDNANILWDASAGQLLFRDHDTTIQAYVDTDGSIVAGAGDVWLDVDGLSIGIGSSGSNEIKFMDSAYEAAEIETSMVASGEYTMYFAINDPLNIGEFHWSTGTSSGTSNPEVTMELANDTEALEVSHDFRYHGNLKPSRTGHSHLSSYVFYPITPTTLKDSSNNSWDFTYSAGTGTYLFDHDLYNTWPADAKAVLIMFGGTWSSANNASLMSARAGASDTNTAQVRAIVASMMQLTQAIVPTDSNGDFRLVVANATSTASGCRMVGYFI